MVDRDAYLVVGRKFPLRSTSPGVTRIPSSMRESGSGDVEKGFSGGTVLGVYYYFYQIFRNRAETAALEKKRLGIGDGSVGMFSSLIVAALSGTHRKDSKESSRTLPDQGLSNALGQTMLSTVEPLAYGTSHVISYASVLVILSWLFTCEKIFGNLSLQSFKIQEVYDEAGVWGFWKGVLPTLIMVSNPSIQFMLYETMLAKLKKRRARSKKDSTGVTALEIFLLGALAKLGATVVTYPLLVVKARLQARQVKNADKRHHYKGTWDAIIKMIRYEGLYGFYKGMGTKIVQSVLAAAVLFMVKEELVKQTRLLLAKGTSNSVKPKPL
ncbi:Mitochondrial substrate/solute carrier [Sesbania bispinosa]|nr:Mitochondrial substrate/solute carrier [Sesbania bispinosa]